MQATNYTSTTNYQNQNTYVSVLTFPVEMLLLLTTHAWLLAQQCKECTQCRIKAFAASRRISSMAWTND